MSHALHLYRLQLLDTEKDQAMARHTSIKRQLQDDVAANNARSALAQVEKELKESRRLLQSAEETVQRQMLKIAQSEAALYGGKVHNPKELQDLQNEVASLKRHLATLEDQQLEAMIHCEMMESKQKQAALNLIQADGDNKSRNSTLIVEQNRLDQDLRRIEAERQAIANALPPEILLHYEQIRQVRRGVAVAIISEESCSACGAELTPAERQAARSHLQLSHCSTCGRILYAG